jgi:hypothetical protein
VTPGRLRPTEPDAEDLGAGLVELLGARVFVDVTIPRTKITGRMRLVGRSEALAITSAARREFQAAGLIEDGRVALMAIADWNAEIGVRHLACAVRDPADESKALAALSEWRECDDEQISALWNRYQDLREELDPLGDHGAAEVLSADDLELMRAAVKKKEPSVLMSFGSRKLAIFATTSDEPPAS